MRFRRLFSISFLLTIVLLGAWLWSRSAGLQPQDMARTRGPRQLSPSGNGSAQGSAPTTGESVILDPVSPDTVDFAQVTIATEDADSKFNRWLRGEIDLGEKEGILGESEIAELEAEARQQEPDPSVREAAAGPSPLAPKPDGSFDGIDFRQSTGTVPPDPELAVGPDHIIAVVNVSVAIYDKSGTTLLGPTAAQNLFSQSACSSGLFDPNVLYDEEADRWIIAYDQGHHDSNGGYCLLASRSPDPLGTWSEYFFPLNDADTWIDFPHAGVGNTYIFMGGNAFNIDTFVEGRIFAFDKFELYFGQPVAARQRGLGTEGATPQPLNLHGVRTGTWPGSGNEHYFLTDPYNGRYYHLRRWNPAADTLALAGRVDLGQGYMPVDATQKGGEEIDANFWQPLDFEYRNGYGWTAMTVSCDPGSGVVNCIRWAQIDLADGSLGPAGSGTYGSNGEHRFFPDLAVNHCGDMAIGYTKSSENMYPAVWVAGRQNGTSPSLLEPEVELKAGEVTYTAFDFRTPPYRWGDYTGMTIDPDGETFWYLGQYSKDTGTTYGRWGTYVGSFYYAGCNVPAPLPQNRRLFLPLLELRSPAPTMPDA